MERLASAQFLAVYWIVHVEFKVHRLRDGFSVGNALLPGKSLPTFIAILFTRFFISDHGDWK